MARTRQKIEQILKEWGKIDDQQIVDRRNNLRRYGSDPDGLAKIIMRVSPLSRLFRNIAVTQQAAQG